MKTSTTKITKLITNQMIIGKTTHSGNITTIEQPYMVVPDPSGIQIFPYDAAILGRELEYITVSNDSTIYSSEVGEELRNNYLTAISGITLEPEKKIIL